MSLAACPSCATRLTVPENLAPDQAIRCPKCKEVFQPSAAMDEPPVSATAYQAPEHLPQPAETAPAPSGAVLLSDRDFPQEWQRGRSRRRRGKGLLIGGIIGGVALLLIAGVAAWLIFGGRSGLTDELRYAPDQTRFVVSLDVRAALRSNAMQQIKKSDVYRRFNDLCRDESGVDVERFVEEGTGLRLQDIERVTVMGTWEEARDREDFDVPYTVVLKTRAATGFRLREPTRRGGGFRNVDIRNEPAGKYTMHVVDRHFAYCVADDRTVVMGPTRTLHSVLRREGQPNFSDSMQALVRKADFSQTAAGMVDLRNIREPDWRRGHGLRLLEDELPFLKNFDGATFQIRAGSDLRGEATLFARDGRVLASYKVTTDVQMLADMFMTTVFGIREPGDFDRPRRGKRWEKEGFPSPMPTPAVPDFDKGFRPSVPPSFELKSPPVSVPPSFEVKKDK